MLRGRRCRDTTQWRNQARPSGAIRRRVPVGLVGGAVVGGLAIVTDVGLTGAAWTPLQIIGAVIVAADIVGGVAA